MGRGRVQLKRIENKINRQVTFSKRRSGLLKKAHEISVLCDAEVAVMVFSTKGKLYEYSTDSSMEKILDRYQRYSYAERALVDADTESQENWCHEYEVLKARIEALQKCQRHLVGEQLDKLTLKEIQQLEQQLEAALRKIRSKKNNVLFDSIAELQRKATFIFLQERALQAQNSDMAKKLVEKDKAEALSQHQQTEQAAQAPTSSFIPHLLSIESTINIRNHQPTGSVVEEAEQSFARCNGAVLPPWMLRL
ncbi:hypothetical protein C4D60_Mb01t06530 [Musa balbisiana]|uniref:Uncharacterized protein n=1 Tax=Musa balbisiana TaxID=52838 RepID=A0A4S8JMR5_MUSBA|nr:hypothetical protein C4D60_Mb01t06530 [Musa balbisiana]